MAISLLTFHPERNCHNETFGPIPCQVSVYQSPGRRYESPSSRNYRRLMIGWTGRRREIDVEKKKKHQVQID